LLFSVDVSQRLWNEVTLNGEDLSYMLDETTPVKACADLAYHVKHDGMVLVSLQLFFLKKICFSLIASCQLSF
jgi:hypothetical protein